MWTFFVRSFFQWTHGLVTILLISKTNLSLRFGVNDLWVATIYPLRLVAMVLV
jgi:hypothetical protein